MTKVPTRSSQSAVLSYLGHAGFCLIRGRTCILMDPWLSGQGAFLHTWFPYPDNTCLKDRVFQHCQDRELYVYISHQHEDHLDIGFLRELDGYSPTYLLPGFSDGCLRAALGGLRGRRIYFADGEHRVLSDGTIIQIFTEESGINTDSAIVARMDGRCFLNLNDCKIFDRLNAIATTPVDILTCQFSGATWHPTCYDYKEAEYKAISLRRIAAKFFQVYKAITTVDPSVYIPSAGPAVFLHPALYHKNFETVNIFPKAEAFVRYLLARPMNSTVRLLRPGDALRLDGAPTDQLFPTTPTYDLEDYRRSKAHLFSAPPDIDPEAVLDAFAGAIKAKLDRFDTKLASKFCIQFGVAGARRRILVDLNRRLCAIVSDQAAFTPLYSIEALPEAVSALVNGAIEWENFCLSFLFRIRREPDEYCPLVNLFLFCSPDNLANALHKHEQFRGNETRISITAGGASFTCRRYCPHQGADLTFGYAEGNFWVCPRHRWRFDLSRGGLAEDGSCSIDAERFDAPPLAASGTAARLVDRFREPNALARSTTERGT
jgi:UDP-MurNAc hydroxylase